MKKTFFIAGTVVLLIILLSMNQEKHENGTVEPPVGNITNQQLVVLKTSQGDITVELFSAKAPKTVENFLHLAKSGFYDDTLFHRVIKNFMVQGGDPLTREAPTDWARHGTGGPGYAFADEINDEKIVRGVLAMANAGADTNGSQFFIVTAAATPWLDGRHTVFGKVIEGMEVVAEIEELPTNSNDHPLTDVVLKEVIVE